MSKRKASRKEMILKARDKDLPSRSGVLPSPRTVSKLIIILTLLATTLVAFGPLRNAAFINLDDNQYVYDNPQVKSGLTLRGVIWAFTTYHAGNWHPLTWLSHMVDYEFYGLSPGGHHFTNVLLHLANTLLLFLLLERMTRAARRSGFVAALFALHPLHVESVAWVAERKDVLSGLFWMLTLWAYVLYTERQTLTRYLVIPFSFAVGLLSKAMLVTLPCVMLLLDYWPLGRLPFGQSSNHGNAHDNSLNGENQRSSTHRVIVEKIPIFALSALSSLVTFLAQQTGGAVRSLELFPLETRIANALVSYLSYIGKMIWPHALAVFYPHPGTLPAWQVAGAGFLLTGVSFLILRAWRKYPYLGVGWLWYLGTLVPVIGLVQVGSQAMADRYTYLPIIGLFIIIAWGVPDLLAGWRYRKTVLALSAVLSLSILMAVTSSQVQRWHDSVTLFKHTLAATTRNPVIHYNLGVALAGQGKQQEAILQYTEVLRMTPHDAQAQNNLGVALADQGKLEDAIAHYNEALRINPQDAQAHTNLGNALDQQGKTGEAIVHYTEALRINPRDAQAHNNLGNALRHLGKIPEAIAHFTEALRNNPHDAQAHNNLGVALAGHGKDEEAIAHYTEALRINPRYAQAHNNLGNTLSRQGKAEEAIAQYREALRINPRYGAAHTNLGNALAQQGKTEEAISHYTEALRIDPRDANAHYNLGVTLARQGKAGEARAHLSEAQRIESQGKQKRKY